MCGIIGFSGKNKQNFNIEKIKILFLYNESRGEDSCGIWTSKNKIIKTLGKASEKIVLNNELLIDNILIGHTRKSSFGYGKADVSNAHPFESEKTIYVHNGTLQDIYNTAKNFGMEYAQVKVDSILIGKSFDEYNCDPKKSMGKLSGVANILMNIKSSPESLFVYKHKERPLFRGECEEGMYISSMEDSLKAIGCSKIKEFADGYWYEIQNGAVTSHFVVKMKEYSQTTTTTTSTYSLHKTGQWIKPRPGANLKQLGNMYRKCTVKYDSLSKRYMVTFDSFEGRMFDGSDFIALPDVSKDDCAHVMGEKGGQISDFRKVIIIGELPVKPYIYNDKCMCIDFEKIKSINSLSEITKDFIEKISCFDLSPMSKDEIDAERDIDEYDISQVKNAFKGYRDYNPWPINSSTFSSNNEPVTNVNEIKHKYNKGDVVNYHDDITDNTIECTITQTSIYNRKASYHIQDPTGTVTTFVPEEQLTKIDLPKEKLEDIKEISDLASIVDDVILVENLISDVCNSYAILAREEEELLFSIKKVKHKLLVYGKTLIEKREKTS